MQIIPVLDLSKGLVVHAKHGERNNYAPIISHLCSSANPIEIINCFLHLYAFKKIYIADLDALQLQGNNIEIIDSICRMYPKLEIWLDTGVSLIKNYLENLKFSSLRIILSTESVDSLITYTSIIKKYTQHRFIFSIDYKSGKILGPCELLRINEQWPTDVIILNLDHVGSNDGIKLPAQLNHHALAKTHDIYYGGGIRNRNDLHELKTLGAAGALVSTSLHNKTITTSDLFSISQ